MSKEFSRLKVFLLGFWLEILILDLASSSSFPSILFFSFLLLLLLLFVIRVNTKTEQSICPGVKLTVTRDNTTTPLSLRPVYTWFPILHCPSSMHFSLEIPLQRHKKQILLPIITPSSFEEEGRGIVVVTDFPFFYAYESWKQRRGILEFESEKV